MAIAERWKGHPSLPDRADPELRYQVLVRARRLDAESPERENEVKLKILREYQDMAPFRRVQRRYLRARYGLDGP